MTEGRQNETVERFRTGDYKVLVATSVGSEGIDVPDCNIVLSYNYTGNEITKIQMSGMDVLILQSIGILDTPMHKTFFLLLA